MKRATRKEEPFTVQTAGRTAAEEEGGGFPKKTDFFTMARRAFPTFKVCKFLGSVRQSQAQGPPWREGGKETLLSLQLVLLLFR